MADRIESLLSLLGDGVSVRWLITLLHFLWQGAVVGVVVVIAGRLLRDAVARMRYMMYSAALLGSLVCVAVTFYVVDAPAVIRSSLPPERLADTSVKSPALPPQTATSIAATQSKPLETTNSITNSRMPNQRGARNATKLRVAADNNAESLSRSPLAVFVSIAPWITVAYAIAVVCFLLRLSAALWSGFRFRTRTTPLTDAKLLRLIAEQADRMKLKCVPVVAYCDRVAVPTVLGVLSPIVLLPVTLTTGLVSNDFAAIIRHELAHISRYDLWMNLAQRVIESLLFFHPAVWFISRRLDVERELCCDDLVVSSGYAPMQYAGALLRAAERCASSRQPSSVALAATGNEAPLLEERIQRLMNWGNTPQLQLTRVGMAGLMMTLVASIVIPGLAGTWASAAFDEPIAAGQSPEPSDTNEDDENLPPGMAKNLRWGKPSNGLRAAIAIRISSDEPKAGDTPDRDLLEIYLVVQNVSTARIRLSDAIATPKPRTLYLKLDGKTVMGLTAGEPGFGNLTLEPREVAIVLMFASDSVSSDGRSIGSLIAEGALKDTRQSMVAEMKIEQAPVGAWTGKLVTGETSGAAATGKPQPNDESAQALFNKWQSSARINGRIPGGALGSLAKAVANFVKHNPTDKRTPQLAEVLKRIDTSRDWTQADAVTLLDDVTAIYASLPQWAANQQRFSIAEQVRMGRPLPTQLEDAPWGQAKPNGLRVAWLLDPRSEQYHLNTPLKSRILFHNAGRHSVVFRILTWNQSSDHRAHDANGKPIRIMSTSWTTLPQIVACRLGPGEFTEVTGAGIGVGANQDREDWREARVGAWIEAKEGDEVTFTPAPVSVDGNDGRARALGEPQWWLAFIRTRLECDAPLPADAAERKRLLNRAVHDLFGSAPNASEIATFVGDRGPNALEALAHRLAQCASTTPFTGTLQSDTTTFRVLPVDPEVAKRPRVATGPGRYSLGDQTRLVIVRKPAGNRRENKASIVFFLPNSTAAPPGEPHAIKLPDGYLTWAIAWERGSTVLWVAEHGVLRVYDLTNPAQVKETRIAPATITSVPEPLRDALRPTLEGTGLPPPATVE